MDLSKLPSPATAVHPALLDQPLPKWEARVPFMVLAALAGFVVSVCIAAALPSSKTNWLLNPVFWLILLIATFSIWFILSFTGPPTSLAKQRECFRFAYSLTVVSFILLVFPYLNVWKPDITGPISLVRGCVVANNASDNAQEQLGSASIKCPPPPADGEPAMRRSDTYPWLLAIGGFVGRTTCYATDKTAAKPTTESACETEDDASRHSRVTSGLVVPFYVVFLAFIGGAVSLSRRIPEYQKRSSPEYRTTSTLPALAPMMSYEAREAVVFQIMQMLSAPFIAITAYWVIAPASIAASIGLAFVSGFSSETILLLIRGVVDGLRPQTAPVTAAASASSRTSAADPATPSNPEVTIRLAIHCDAPIDVASMTLTCDGAPVTLTSDGFVELSLLVGRQHVLVASARSHGAIYSGALTVTPTADDEGKPYTLELQEGSP